jgi:hypothetical protein
MDKVTIVLARGWDYSAERNWRREIELFAMKSDSGTVLSSGASRYPERLKKRTALLKIHGLIF